jgi:D-glycero-alpha-D-manno-heptose-7-phosphate kinase
MIISRTPYRVSFFGGGTDYPQWYLKEGGAVLSTTIDKYCYISCRILPPFYELKYRIVWSHIENVSSRSEILHPAVREGLRYLGIDNGIGLEIHHYGDLPSRSGMGSSSSFVVGLFKALLALKGRVIGKNELAAMAIEFEQSVLKENVGSQDQVAVTHGGFNTIHFFTTGAVQVEPLTISASRIAELESHLMLLYTGSKRLSSDVAGDFIANFSKKSIILKEMFAMVNAATALLAGSGNITDFGRLLHESWKLKKSVSDRVSTEIVDLIYETARSNGAIGGKLLGAGSSGFLLLFVPPEKQQQIRKALPLYLTVPFKFETMGSSIIYYERDNYDAYSN